MKILFLGDIVGKTGRKCLHVTLPVLIKNEGIDFVIANGENAAGGAGLTEKTFQELRMCGIDVVTSGNHIWDQKDIYKLIDHEPRIIRPANYPPDTTPGKGAIVTELNNGRFKVAVLNLMGRVFMKQLDCPFRIAEKEIKRLKGETKNIIVDFHAEATSEKQALGWFLDGEVSAVIGTHTHVQTADERLLLKNTAYITDVGMVGLYNSVLGVDTEGPLKRFLTQMPHRLSISAGKTLFNAVIVTMDGNTGQTVSIKRINEII